MAKKNKHRSPQQKDDRATAKELVTLSTAIIQLLAAIITLVIILLKEK